MVEGVRQKPNGRGAATNRPTKKRETSGTVVRYRGGVDRIFLGIVIIMVLFGTIMIASASYANSLEYKKDSYFFIKKQAVMAVLGLLAMVAMIRFADYMRLEKCTWVFFVVTMAVNYLTAFFGPYKNGARRWIDIPVLGISFQPSEFLKLAVVMVFAWCISKKTDEMKKTKWGVVVSFLITLLAMVSMLLQKHISGLIIVGVLCLAMMAIGGTPTWFLGLAVACSGFGLYAVNEFTGKIVGYLTGGPLDHVAKRLATWKDPYAYPLEGGHQIIQSLYAIGSGGWTGVGLGQSKQKYLYLPEPQNDYIFAIICEELGYIGAILIIAAFCMLVVRGVRIAYRAPDRFSSCLVMGITIKVALQALLNIAVVTNIIPATGITMPFFSYGGTALVILMAEMGIVLSVSKYSYEKPKKE